MCQFCSESNEQMEPNDNKLIEINEEEHVNSSVTNSVNNEQGPVQKDASNTFQVRAPSPAISLRSCESFASNYSEDSVYVNSFDDGLSREDVSGSGREDSENSVNKAQDRSLILKENHQQGKNGYNLDSSSTDNDDSTSSDESFEEEDAATPAFYERDEIWDPPEAENTSDDVENSMTTLDDEDDDEYVDADSSEWAMPRSKEKQVAREKVKNGKFKDLVSQLLGKVGVVTGNGDENWVDIVADLAWQAAKYVKPGATEGKTMDPSGYVKIKCVAAGSPGQSRLIKGLVFKKHAAHKHMTTNYKNPKLLLIQGMLGPSSGSSGLSSFNSMISEDKVNSDDLIQNVQACQPNVILVEKSASRAVMAKILQMGVTLVLDMKISRLERVARCTGSPILSSDVILNQTLRHCDSLYFEKFVEEHAIVGEGGKKPSKTLMFLEGCPTRLGCTILLKGSHGAELKKIKCVVQCAVVMAYHLLLETSFLVDQNAMFSTIAFEEATETSSTDEQSTSTVYESSSIRDGGERNVHNSSEDGVQVVPISNGGDEDSYVQEPTAQYITHFHGLHDKDAEVIASPSGIHDKVSDYMQLEAGNPSTVCCEPHMTTISAASSSFSQVMKKVSVVSPVTFENMSTYLNGSEPESQTAVSIPILPSEDSSENKDKEERLLSNDGETKESTDDGETMEPADDGEEIISAKDEISSVLDSESILVLMSIRNALKGTICEQSHFSHIKFYRNFDVPLGKFLWDNLFNQTLKCQACSHLPEAHIYYYAHHSKQLTIRVKQLKKTLPRESEGKLWMWSRCSKCEPDMGKATKRVLISTAARGLSFGKFLELSFSSQSAFNRIASCGHCFQKDFLYFFGLGSMVAMFQYSRVAIYNISVPAQKLEFNSSIQRDGLQPEIRTVYTIGLVLFNELEKYLMKIESRFSGLNLVLNGLSKGFADILDILRMERSKFEENFKNRNEDSDEPAFKFLSLNRLRWEILLEACVWDRRLQSLLSSFSTLPQSTTMSASNEVVKRKMELKKDVSSGEGESMERQIPSEEHGSQGEGDVAQEIADEAKQGREDSRKEHRDDVIIVDKQVTLHGDDRICDKSNDMDMELQIEMVSEGENASVKKSMNEEISTSLFVEQTIPQPTSSDSVPSVSFSCESDGSTLSPSHLHSDNESVQQDNVSRSISIEADEEICGDGKVSEKQPSPILKLDSQWWVPFEITREEFLEDLVKDRPSKFGYLPKFELLHSPDLLPMVSQVIIEEGSRLHVPLRDGNFIVSDFDGEMSSSVACALALTNEVPAHPTSSSDETTTLKRAVSEPWPLSHALDPDFIHSASSLSFTESHLSSFGRMDSVVSYGRLQNEVTLGLEKNLMKGKYSVVIIYPNEFRSLRDRCCPSELDYIASLSRCKPWDAKGGKSKSVFAKTLDDRLIVKEIKKTEFDSFMKFAPYYFDYMKKSVHSGNQTCLAKILGIYQVTIRNPKSGKETKHDLMVQENLSFGRNITRQYDLKGALHARFTAAADGSGDVLLDQNFVNDMNSSPLYVGQKAKRLLQRAIWNDTTFLKEIGVMDYSLLVGVDRQQRELVCGIIDYLRQYTWDKQFETWVKSSLVVPKNTSPTIISPQEYKKRFRKFMDTHFLTVPDHWCSHRSSNPCNLCVIKSQDSIVKPSEKLEEESNGGPHARD